MRNALRAGVRGLGELLITAGLVLLLFCAYQLVWTNVEAHRAQHQVGATLRDEWKRPETRPGGTIRLSSSDFGKGFAFLHIPRLGRKYSVPVVEGVTLPDLSRGVGHYPTTALPGAVGNFAVAGHRATNGEPFAHLDRVKPGDSLVVETRDTWFTYVVDRTKIVLPTDVWVLEPVPGKPGKAPTRKLITLTTCDPRWGSTHRLIIFGHLTDEQQTTDGRPAVLAKGV
ncbi:MAG: class E sortase [Actinomycetes bacterium]